MQRRSLVDFWSTQTRTEGCWCHPLDAPLLSTRPHSFNLDFPVSPYVGDVLRARVVILGANAGYNPLTTPLEFPDVSAIDVYLSRVRSPDTADWSALHKYYETANYGYLIPGGQAVLVNCCAYRSPSIAKEKDNRALIGELPSCALTRQWLEESLVPLAQRGELMIVAKRYGLWNIGHLKGTRGVIFDPAPVSPHLSHGVFTKVREFLSGA